MLTVSIDTSCLLETQPQISVAYELQFYLRFFTSLPCLPQEQLETQK